MNAYELAKQLEERHAPYEDDAANMLRQQADRIAELEKQRKPVAWMNGNEICPEIGYEATITTEHPKDLGWKPLFTTPQTKPLSDEEIMDIAERSDYSPIEIEMGYDYEIRIARAIEERHGIK